MMNFEKCRLVNRRPSSSLLFYPGGGKSCLCDTSLIYREIKCACWKGNVSRTLQ